MKALILAAGFGTRLLPMTRHLPKPLFPLGGCPLLDIVIQQLVKAGCKAIAVNTHHLHDQIKAHVQAGSYPIPVQTIFEPKILGTGGAIRNLAHFWDDRPFFVVNSDIFFDIDLKAIYDFHLEHSHPATLVLVDHPDFNTVAATPSGAIVSFSRSEPGDYADATWLTFTGIQVLDPRVVSTIPKTEFYSSIDAYRSLLAEGYTIAAYVAAGACWQDLGTPARYRAESLARLEKKLFPDRSIGPISKHRLAGDGSDREWYRLQTTDHSLVLADHGFREISLSDTAEIDAFCRIGNHLRLKGVPVPCIYLADPVSGFVFLEDLGDVHLQDAAKRTYSEEELVDLYRPVIDALISMFLARDGFDPAWTWQTARYDRQLILDRECGYFMEAFLKGYMGINSPFHNLQPEFERIADGAISNGLEGLMHRDFQSRNIMIKNKKPWIIDFQGARLGPIQYDLASLLIDPYVGLPERVKKRLLAYCVEKLAARTAIDRDQFMAGCRFAALTRNLQILGAFGFLTRVKGKPGFEQYIQPALKTLTQNLADQETGDFPELSQVVRSAF